MAFKVGLVSIPTLKADMHRIKAVYTLEMKRRENDRRIITLHVEMKDMMGVLVQYVWHC